MCQKKGQRMQIASSMQRRSGSGGGSWFHWWRVGRLFVRKMKNIEKSRRESGETDDEGRVPIMVVVWWFGRHGGCFGSSLFRRHGSWSAGRRFAPHTHHTQIAHTPHTDHTQSMRYFLTLKGRSYLLPMYYQTCFVARDPLPTT
jgi:hypothetical protein